jgi:DNA-binding SARP family transcriptional activator/pimeloyl-ACP methyl ester carboxylesterase
MERALLALLLRAGGATVLADVLVEDLWPSGAPRSAAKTLQTYVSHLRRSVGALLVREGGGYALRIGPDDEVDAGAFERDAIEGRLALVRDDPATAALVLGRALSRWRGPAFADVDGLPTIDLEAARLEELRLGVTEDWFEARLTHPGDATLLADVERFVAQHPLRERGWAMLMRSQHAAGLQADALRTYQRARQVLAEIGVEPGAELRATEVAILTGALDDGPSGPLPTYVVTADGAEIACTIAGTGARDLVLCLEWAFHLELLRQSASMHVLVDRLGALGRLMTVQRRDTGQSGRTRAEGLTPPEGCVPDIDAVLDHAASDRATLVGWGHGSQVALAYAALRPARVEGVVAISGYPRLAACDDYQDGLAADFLEAFLELLERSWGAEVSGEPIFGPVVGNDAAVMAAVARINRLTATPRQAVAMQRDSYWFDIRPLLPEVRCPVLVVGLEQSITGLAGARALAAMVPGSRYVELPGWFIPSEAEVAAIADEIDAFVSAIDGRSTLM